MKLRLNLLFALCILAGFLCPAFALGSGTKAIGNFFLRNGSRIDSVAFEMPNEYDSQIKIKIDGKQQKLATDSIDCIILWNKKYPEQKHLIKPFIVENVDIDTGEITGYIKRPIWLCCEQVEANASLWIEIGRPTFKKGNLRFNFRSYCSHMSMNYVLKKGKDNPAYIKDKKKDIKKFLIVYLGDDPKLIERLEADEYDVTYDVWGNKYIDTSRVISDYNPQ